MKKLLPFVVFPLLCVIAITCTGGAGFPTTRGVYVDTNGVIISPSNFWLVNLTNANSYYLPVSNGVAVNLVNSGNPFISEGSGSQSIQLGEGASSGGSFATAVGLAARTTNFSATAVGISTLAGGDRSTALGSGAFAVGDFSTALGHNASAIHERSTAIGSGSATTATNQTSVAGHLKVQDYGISGTGWVLSDVGANIPTNAVPVGSAVVTNWLLTTIGGIPQLVATNHADGGWMQKALFP